MNKKLRNLLIDSLLDKGELDIAIALEDSCTDSLTISQKNILLTTASKVKVSEGYNEHVMEMGVTGNSSAAGSSGRSLCVNPT